MFLTLAAVLASLASSALGRQWIAVVAPEFRETIELLARQRTMEGWKVAILAATDERGALMEKISGLANQDPEPSCLLLVGDFAEGPAGVCVPPGRGTQARMNGKPSDRSWALADGKLARAIPTGRLPARTTAEAALMVQKILTWPAQSRGVGVFPEARLILGNHTVPAPFGDVADQLMNRLAQNVIRQLPAPWTMDATIHINGSPWQIYFADVPSAAQEIMKLPATFLAFMGHSGRSGGDSARRQLLTVQDWRQLPGDLPHIGLFFSCGCHTCDFVPEEEAFGVVAMRTPGGPAGVIGSQGETFAAMGYLAIGGMLTAMNADPAPRLLGDFWQGAQKGLAEGKIDAADFQMLDMADGSDRKIPLETQRLEHLESWMLLGDPAMPLVRERLPIGLKAASAPVAGGSLEVSGDLSPALAGARLHITLERQPGTVRTDLPEVQASGEPRQIATQKRRALSNDTTIASTEATAEGGSFKAALPIPATLPDGPWIVRAVSLNREEGGGGVIVLPTR